MAQARTLLGEAHGLRVERVRFHDKTSQWSPVYRTPGRRVVLPASGAVRLRSAAGELLIDPLTAFCIEAGVDYQLHPEPAGERSSLVLSEDGDSAAFVARAWLLSPSELFGMRVAVKAGSFTAEAQRAQRAAEGMESVWLGPAAPPVTRARRHLLSEVGRDAPVGEIAEAAFCSPFHLARLFRQHTGLSLHAYCNRLRIALALQRLEAGDRDLAGLAQDLGFCSQSHFGAVFRREIGVPPGQARAALTFS